VPVSNTIIIGISDPVLQKKVSRALEKLEVPFYIPPVAAHDLMGRFLNPLYIGIIVCLSEINLGLLHQIKQNKLLKAKPLIVIVDKADLPKAFFAGADEVLTLPLDYLELEWRLRIKLLPKIAPPESQDLPQLGHSFFVKRYDDTLVKLTPAELQIYNYLTQSPNKAYSAEHLLQKALGFDHGLGNPQTLHTHIRNLRKKLEQDPNNPISLLRTADGYLWCLR
jgi:DNA-binding response OmpR family regulator